MAGHTKKKIFLSKHKRNQKKILKYLVILFMMVLIIYKYLFHNY